MKDPQTTSDVTGMDPAMALVTLFWEMPDVTVAILRLDGGGIVDVNDAVEDLTGIPRAEVIGLPSLKELWLEANELPQLLETIQTAGVVAGYPFSVRHRSGEVRYGHVWARRCSVEEHPAIVLVAREATESLRSERLLATEHAVTGLLSRVGSRGEVVAGLLATIGERLGWDAALWWAAGAAGELRAADLWVSGLLEPRPQLTAVLGTQLARGEGFPGRVMSCGRAMWLEDVAAEAGGARWAAVAAAAGLHTSMAFPVRAASHTFGVAQILIHDRLPVEEALLETADVLGRNAGMFLRAMR